MFTNKKLLKTIANQPGNHRSVSLFYKSIEKTSNRKGLMVLTTIDSSRWFFNISNNTNNTVMVDRLYSKVFRATFTNEVEKNEFILKHIKHCIRLIPQDLNTLTYKSIVVFSIVRL
jgi:hypothetical protein